jgi:hypothetical protein
MSLSRQNLRRTLFLFSVVVSIAAFELPSGQVRHGLDPSIRYAANVYGDHDLEFGRDLVHVFGPLGYITYPMAGKHHLLHTWLTATLLRFLFIGAMTFFALKTGKVVDASLILVVSAFFFSQQVRVHESHVYGTCLLLFLLDLRLRGSWLGYIGAVVAAFFAFVKFNMFVTLVLLFLSQIAVARLFFKEPLTRTLTKNAVFIAGFLTLARLYFDSPSSFTLWIVRSWGIATGNSEAMSLPAQDGELVTAAITIVLFFTTGYLLIRSEGRSFGISWMVLAIIPFFFEFKHGFVRADRHILSFFFFAPVAVASSLVFGSGRQLKWVLLGAVILAALGPSVRRRPPDPFKWVSGLRFNGARLLLRVEEIEKRYEKRNKQLLQQGGLSAWERSRIRGHTVDFVPQDVTFIDGTDATWRPSPFFQYLLVRNTGADSINRRHIESEDAAEFMIMRWIALNGIHPWYWAPATYEAVLNNYSVVGRTDDRLLLQRIPSYRLQRVFLSATTARWKTPIFVPESAHMVIASIRLTPSFFGRVLKAAYSLPPVYVTIDSTTTYRFVPSTAPNGLVVSHVPGGLLQFEYLLKHGRIPPMSKHVNSMTVWSEGSSASFRDCIEISFYEIQIHPRDENAS